uniref:Uncharacterized protein n=1 Tax=Anguilla anguilla TaxID=7936 RepID=A0A0E9PKZ7_ANGAN
MFRNNGIAPHSRLNPILVLSNPSYC